LIVWALFISNLHPLLIYNPVVSEGHDRSGNMVNLSLG